MSSLFQAYRFIVCAIGNTLKVRLNMVGPLGKEAPQVEKASIGCVLDHRGISRWRDL